MARGRYVLRRDLVSREVQTPAGVERVYMEERCIEDTQGERSFHSGNFSREFIEMKGFGGISGSHVI